jgi:hypothetical protein
MLVVKKLVAVLLLLGGAQGVALAEGKCAEFAPVVSSGTERCATGNPGVSLSLGRLDETEVVADLYIKIANPSSRPVSFSFWADTPNFSWVFVQEQDGAFAPISGLQFVMSGGGARAVSLQPGQIAWYQVRIQGWETLKVGEIKKIFIGFSVIGPDADTLKKIIISPLFIGRTLK